MSRSTYSSDDIPYDSEACIDNLLLSLSSTLYGVLSIEYLVLYDAIVVVLESRTAGNFGSSSCIGMRMITTTNCIQLSRKCLMEILRISFHYTNIPFSRADDHLSGHYLILH